MTTNSNSKPRQGGGIRLPERHLLSQGCAGGRVCGQEPGRKGHEEEALQERDMMSGCPARFSL